MDRSRYSLVMLAVGCASTSCGRASAPAQPRSSDNQRAQVETPRVRVQGVQVDPPQTAAKAQTPKLSPASDYQCPSGTASPSKKVCPNTTSCLSVFVTDVDGKAALGAAVLLRAGSKRAAEFVVSKEPVIFSVAWQGEAQVSVFYLDTKMAEVEVSLSRQMPQSLCITVDASKVPETIYIGAPGTCRGPP